MSGTVVARHVYEGQYVKEGDKLFEIADFSTMWFLFDAYERDLAWLKPGQPVDVVTPAVPGKTFTGTIGFIDWSPDTAPAAATTTPPPSDRYSRTARPSVPGSRRSWPGGASVWPRAVCGRPAGMMG